MCLHSSVLFPAITVDLAAKDASFNHPVAVGGTIASVAGVIIILLAVSLWMRRKQLSISVFFILCLV